MGGALVCFCAMAVAVRELAAAGMGVFEILALRCLGGLLLLLPWALLAPPPRRGRGGGWRPLPRLHLARNLVHFGGQAGWAYGLTALPMATVFALEFTAPAWTTLLAVLFLGERATPARIGALALGLLGVLIVLRPGAEAFRPEALVVLASALCFAVALVVMKRMTLAAVATLPILLWMNALQLPLNLAVHLGASGGAPPWRALAAEPAALLPAAAALCLGGLLAQVSVVSAFRHGDAATVVPLDFLRIPAIAAVGAALYAEPIDGFVLLGAAVAAAGIAWVLRDARARGGG